VREYFLTLLVTATVTYLLTPLVRQFAIRAGAVPATRERDVHAEPIPRMGGVAMFLGLAAGLLVAGQLVPLRSVFPGSGLVSGLLLAGGLIVIIGMIDDRWGMNALGKLAGQVAAGGILAASGAQLSSFPEPRDHLFSLTPNESIVLTVLVVVATINAVNFIDGLDGLAAGIVCIAAISFFSYYYTLAKVGGFSAEGAPALASVVLTGACLGFLPHNFYPARIFMGDTGSMLLGLLLSYVPISAISSLDYISLNNKANRFPEILPLLLPAAVLVIPYIDMLRVVVRRTRAGLSPFAADRRHLHHRMLEVGHSHRSSVLILYAWAALFSGVVVLLSFVTTPLLVLALVTIVAVLVLVLLSIPKLRWWERRGRRAADRARPGRRRAGRPLAPEPAPAAGAPGPVVGSVAEADGVLPGSGGRGPAGQHDHIGYLRHGR
jgi:UDP-GlcNAc:undecaprenyl-phosphate/decaprenyl-phosphate GlcNAc-1-phosphate transferase